VDFEQQGSDVTVRGEKGDDSSGWFDGWDGDELKVRYRITVPRRYNTDLETAGGSIRVADLEGEVIAETAGGSITARITKQPQESSELSSSAGSVTVYLAEGGRQCGCGDQLWAGRERLPRAARRRSE
jgi:hypothetical protein